jgi:BRCT domain type II-containing protein
MRSSFARVPFAVAAALPFTTNGSGSGGGQLGSFLSASQTRRGFAAASTTAGFVRSSKSRVSTLLHPQQHFSALLFQEQRRHASSSSSSKKMLLAGKTLVFTGTLTMPRREAVAMAERSGATVVRKFSSTVTHVVTGAKAGSKLTKAQAQGVAVWTEADFLNKMTVEDHEVRLGQNKGRHIAEVAKTGFQFSLAWDALVDLDIKLQTPKGLVYYQNRKPFPGAGSPNLDVDRIPGTGRPWTIRPVENIVCDAAVNPGHYQVVVVYYSNFNNVNGAIPYTLHCRVGKDHGALLHNTISKVGDGIGGDKTGDTVCTFSVKKNGEVDDVKFGAATPKTSRWTPASNVRTPVVSPATPFYRHPTSFSNSTSSSGSTSLRGKAVVFTGTLAMQRSVAGSKAKAAGAKMTKDISRSTDFLVCGVGAGSKKTSALSWGVKVLTEAEFLALV